ncbi:hypothetical protein C5Y96_24810 [Blastopirellula marina]|uniref:Uncharacterized protein n=1 Tax=Blastopirellula marina TaxID=124 RepID=A0A2S8F069_9BACT|nr:hypothetical protein C5Y96_24810 [Blastopirellula marina]RCS42522.1 hypothetical protein DTL36_24860 [Bremerella cremea]
MVLIAANQADIDFVRPSWHLTSSNISFREQAIFDFQTCAKKDAPLGGVKGYSTECSVSKPFADYCFTMTCEAIVA